MGNTLTERVLALYNVGAEEQDIPASNAEWAPQLAACESEAGISQADLELLWSDDYDSDERELVADRYPLVHAVIEAMGAMDF